LGSCLRLKKSSRSQMCDLFLPLFFSFSPRFLFFFCSCRRNVFFWFFSPIYCFVSRRSPDSPPTPMPKFLHSVSLSLVPSFSQPPPHTHIFLPFFTLKAPLLPLMLIVLLDIAILPSLFSPQRSSFPIALQVPGFSCSLYSQVSMFTHDFL